MGAANRISAETPTNPPPMMQKICRQISDGTALASGAVISAGQLGYLLEGVDW